jgi:hypothetical protein
MPRMQRIVRAFPVLPGQEEAARQLARDMGTTRQAEAAEFYARFGVAHECWFTQQTPQGLLMIAITDFGGRPVAEAASEYATSLAPFEAWFKERVLAISGIDQATQPLGPPTECVYDWPPRHQ